MVALQFRSPILGVALAASAHAISDVQAPTNLWPYLIVPVPLPLRISTIMFSICSVIHFGYDIGLNNSMRLHTLCLIVSKINYECGCTLMCLYYTLVHVPLQLIQVHRTSTLLFNMIVLSFAVLLPITSRLKSHMYINDWMQRLVSAHVFTTMLSGLNMHNIY